MSHDYPRSIMSRASKMRGSQAADHRDGSPARQMNSRAQQQAVLTGSVAILWDMENCPVPSEVKADDVAGNVRMALRMHPVIQGAVTFFSAYGDFNHFPRKVREGCQRTGVNLIDVPNGKKDASDKAILVDLFLFALDNAPPCTIFLISGDVDFAPALHKLGQRGYTVVLAIPSGVGVSSALCSAGRFVWDWPSVARGGGLVPAKNFPSRSSVDERMAEIQLRSSAEERMAEIQLRSSAEERMAEIIDAGERGPAWSQEDDSDLPSDDPAPYEEIVVWRSPAPRAVDHAALDASSSSRLDHAAQQRSSGPSSSIQSASGKSPPLRMFSPASRAHQQSSQPSVGRETTAAVRPQVDVTRSSSVAKGSSKNVAVPPENLQALREQLVRLLSLNGSKMEMSRVSAEYQKLYGKPLFPGEYGHSGTKLVNLLERLREWLFMRGDGATKTLHLTKPGSRVAAKLKRDANKNRGVPRDEVEVVDVNLIRVEDVGDVDDETAGEEVIVGSAIKGMQTLITEAQSVLLADKDTQKPHSPQKKSEREHKEELEEIHLPRYDWGFGSGGSRDGSGDEKDNLLQEQKDVEVDESTVEQIVKFKGKNKRATGLDILDVFRLELQELLVSYACEIPMTGFVTLYEQRYSKVLDYEKFGVKDLESLIEKVGDVAVIMEGSYVVAHRIPHDLRVSEKTERSGVPQESEA